MTAWTATHIVAVSNAVLMDNIRAERVSFNVPQAPIQLVCHVSPHNQCWRQIMHWRWKPLCLHLDYIWGRAALPHIGCDDSLASVSSWVCCCMSRSCSFHQTWIQPWTCYQLILFGEALKSFTDMECMHLFIQRECLCAGLLKVGHILPPWFTVTIF